MALNHVLVPNTLENNFVLTWGGFGKSEAPFSL